MNLDPLLHALGLDERHREPWRDHYVTSADDAAILSLVEAGLMTRARTPGFLGDGDAVFVSTKAGRAAAIAEHERRHPKPSRGRARYHDWLSMDGSISFGDYLRRRVYRGEA